MKPLTDAVLKRVKPGITLADGLVPGLRYRSGTWILRYRHDEGERRLLKQVKLGALPVMDLEKARARARELKAERQAGTSPQAFVQMQKDEMAAGNAAHAKQRYEVRDLLIHYGNEHINQRRSKKGIYESVNLFKRLPEEFMERPAQTIQRSEAHGLLQLFEAPSVRRTLGRELRAAWDHAIAAGRIEERNPFVKLKLPPQGKRGRYLNDAELKLLLAWLPSLPRTSRDVLHLMLLCGPRPVEVCSLRRTDVQGNVAQLLDTKTGNPRDLHLPMQAQAIIDARPVAKRAKDAVWLFPSPTMRGKHLDQKAAYLGIYARRDDMPVKDFTLYDARRTFRTGLSRIGCPQEVAELLIGHSKAGIVGVYDLSSRPEEQRLWVQKWADHLDTLRP